MHDLCAACEKLWINSVLLDHSGMIKHPHIYHTHTTYSLQSTLIYKCMCIPASDQALLPVSNVASLLAPALPHSIQGWPQISIWIWLCLTKQEAATYHTPTSIPYLVCIVQILCLYMYEQSMNKSSLHYCYHCGFEHTHFQNTTNYFQNNISTLQICSAEHCKVMYMPTYSTQNCSDLHADINLIGGWPSNRKPRTTAS